MALTCNIDAAGKRVRLRLALATLLCSAIFVALAFFLAIFWLYWLALVGFISGGFTLFEARAGWCALRAMGIKTRV